MSYEQLGRYEARDADTTVRITTPSTRNTSGQLGNYELRNLDGGLGFSLKRPKWLRKLQPGKVLKKIAIPLAVVGGALLIPGAAPLLAKVAMGAARFAGKGILGAGRLTRKGVFGLFKSPVPPGFIGPPAPEGTPGTESVIQQALDVAKQYAPAENVPGGSQTMPGQSSPATTPSGGDGGNYAGGGGGSYASYPSSTAAMDESAPGEPAAAGVGAPKPGMAPLLFGVGAVLLLSTMSKKSRR